MKDEYDVIIVGARAAGAATAMLLARAGLSVLLVERGTYGTDTQSTHALMRGAVVLLDRWGLLPRIQRAGTPAITRTTFYYGDERIAVDLRAQHGTHALYAPRRTHLDSTLVDAAWSAGADVRFRTRVVDVLRDGARIVGVQLENRHGVRDVRARYVVGADGRHSTVAKLVDAPILHRADTTASTLYAYFSGLPDDGYAWFYERESAAGFIPTNDDLHCVFAATDPATYRTALQNGPHAAFEQVLATCPHAERLLRGASLESRIVGFSGLEGVMRQCTGDGWLLLGDAGCFKDPLTAHGITDALRDAELGSRAIVSSLANDATAPFADFAATRDAYAEPMLRISAEIASFSLSFAELQTHHRALSRENKREAEHMAAIYADRAAA